jgi:hypothetical protein
VILAGVKASPLLYMKSGSVYQNDGLEGSEDIDHFLPVESKGFRIVYITTVEIVIWVSSEHSEVQTTEVALVTRYGAGLFSGMSGNRD